MHIFIAVLHICTECGLFITKITSLVGRPTVYIIHMLLHICDIRTRFTTKITMLISTLTMYKIDMLLSYLLRKDLVYYVKHNVGSQPHVVYFNMLSHIFKVWVMFATKIKMLIYTLPFYIFDMVFYIRTD